MYRKNRINRVCVQKDMRDQIFDERSFPIRINLGCGVDKLDGYVNVDGNPEVDADIHMNLDDRYLVLPWDKEFIHLFYVSHLIEHITYINRFKTEMTRCLEPGGVIVVIAPNYLSLDAWGDDTHVRGMSIHSFFPDYWPGCNCIRTGIWDMQDSLGNPIQWVWGVMQKKSPDGTVSI